MNLEERIKPALNLTKGTELTSEEFQQSLYEFFEKKGIISNLRAHLRSQLVNVLKETSLGKAIILKKPEISPKLQAQNLLIAEYLLQRNYHYTLSVLSSEVPLNNAFPPVSLDNGKSENEAFHFSKNDLFDILEALGLNRQPDIAAKLSHKYHSSSKQSLLTCILHNVPKVLGQQKDEKDANVKSWLNKNGMESLNLESMIMLLKTTGVHIDIILKICELVKEAVINEVRSLRKLKDIQMSKLKKHMYQQAVLKKNKYKEKFDKLEMFYKNEKVRLETELEATKERLKEASQNVQAKYNDITQLNNHICALETRLKQQEQSLLTKEQSLQQRQELLENKQKLINQQFEEMQLISRSQQSIITMKDTHESKTKEIGTKSVKAVAHVATVTDPPDQHIVEDRKQDLEMQHENDSLKRAGVDQQNEITKLKDQNLSYQNKIQELLLRTNSLMDQMETRNMHVMKTCTPLSPRLSYYVGGGEEGDVGKRQRYSPTLRKTALIHSSSSSGNVTPTDNVLHEAKLRLLELERESVVIDKHFETLPKSDGRAADSSAACLIHTFQSNVSLIRDSLNKIFSSDQRYNLSPRKSKPIITLTESDENIIRSAEPTGYREAEQDADAECGDAERKSILKERNEAANNSGSSSGAILIDTSLSTLDMSADVARISSQSEWVDIGEL